MFNYTSCPVCKNQSFSPFLTCEDHTVSHEKFNIVSCNSCGFKFTNPIPEPDKLGSYYKSEDYISHSDTRKGIISKLYHAVRSYTLKKKLALVSSYVSRGTILDYGCGTGMFLKTCQQNGWDVTGVEPDQNARITAEKTRLSVFEDIGALKANRWPQTYNAITLWHVLEHITDLETTLKFIKENLEEKGVLIIAVPNHKAYDAEHYGAYWAAYDVPRHLYHFEKTTISKLLNQYGFSLVETKPMAFDSFYVSMLSEKYKGGSINYFKAFLTGLRSNLIARSTGNYSSLIYVFKAL